MKKIEEYCKELQRAFRREELWVEVWEKRESEEKFNEFCEEWIKSTGYGQGGVGEFSQEVYKKYYLIKKLI